MKKELCSIAKKGIRKIILSCGLVGRRIICILDYYRYYRKIPNLKNPTTIGEKIQWIKMYYYNPLYVKCADKVLVKDYVREKLGGGADNIFPRTYRIYENPEEIHLSELPVKFVLKPNHSTNKVLICTDKSQLDERKVIRTAKQWGQENFYYIHGEWQYKEIEPKIICEELLEEDIIDYRIFCFDGTPKFVRATKHSKEAKSGYTANFYDIDWKELGCVLKGDIKGDFNCPVKWKEMLRISEKLSEDFFFVRVDLYETGGKVYFAELTFTSHNGMMDFIPDKYNKIFGDMINIPNEGGKE